MVHEASGNDTRAKRLIRNRGYKPPAPTVRPAFADGKNRNPSSHAIGVDELDVHSGCLSPGNHHSTAFRQL